MPVTWSDQNTSGSDSGSWAGLRRGATTSACSPLVLVAILGSSQRSRRNWPKVAPGSDPTVHPFGAAMPKRAPSTTLVPAGAAAGGRPPAPVESLDVSRVASTTTSTAMAATTATIAVHGASRRYQGAIGVMVGAVAAGKARAPMCGLAGGAPGRYRFTGLGATPATRGAAGSAGGTAGVPPDAERCGSAIALVVDPALLPAGDATDGGSARSRGSSMVLITSGASSPVSALAADSTSTGAAVGSVARAAGVTSLGPRVRRRHDGVAPGSVWGSGRGA